MRRIGLVLILSTTLAAAFGCVERAPELSPADRGRLESYVGSHLTPR